MWYRIILGPRKTSSAKDPQWECGDPLKQSYIKSNKYMMFTKNRDCARVGVYATVTCVLYKAWRKSLFGNFYDYIYAKQTENSESGRETDRNINLLLHIMSVDD